MKFSTIAPMLLLYDTAYAVKTKITWALDTKLDTWEGSVVDFDVYDKNDLYLDGRKEAPVFKNAQEIEFDGEAAEIYFHMSVAGTVLHMLVTVEEQMDDGSWRRVMFNCQDCFGQSQTDDLHRLYVSSAVDMEAHPQHCDDCSGYAYCADNCEFNRDPYASEISMVAPTNGGCSNFFRFYWDFFHAGGGTWSVLDDDGNWEIVTKSQSRDSLGKYYNGIPFNTILKYECTSQTMNIAYGVRWINKAERREKIIKAMARNGRIEISPASSGSYYKCFEDDLDVSICLKGKDKAVDYYDVTGPDFCKRHKGILEGSRRRNKVGATRYKRLEIFNENMDDFYNDHEGNFFTCFNKIGGHTKVFHACDDATGAPALATKAEVEANLDEVKQIIRKVKKPGWKKDAVILLADDWTIGGWGRNWDITELSPNGYYSGKLCFTDFEWHQDWYKYTKAQLAPYQKSYDGIVSPNGFIMKALFPWKNTGRDTCHVEPAFAGGLSKRKQKIKFRKGVRILLRALRSSPNYCS